MTYFLKSGTRYNVSRETLDLHDRLPVGTYTVKFDQTASRFFLEQIEGFNVKGKIYGDIRRRAERILSTFNDRTASTGVLLTGEKGSGKTLLAKMVAVKAAEDGVPTIVINEPWCGEGFNTFMQMIEQPTIILFDEFEKVYNKDDQEKMLTLLDGVYPSKKLFVLTCNDKWRVDAHMRNRPGRIFYSLDFKGLEQDFIIEYCECNLQGKEHIGAVCKIAMMFNQFNFDMLKALVEEMNRYGETPQQAIEMLNAKPEYSADAKYKVVLRPQGADTDEKFEWNGNPLTNRISLDYKVYKDEVDEDGHRDCEWKYCQFTTSDLRHIDPTVGTFVFVNELGDRVTLNTIKEKPFHYIDAFK